MGNMEVTPSARGPDVTASTEVNAAEIGTSNISERPSTMASRIKTAVFDLFVKLGDSFSKVDLREIGGEFKISLLDFSSSTVDLIVEIFSRIFGNIKDVKEKGSDQVKLTDENLNKLIAQGKKIVYEENEEKFNEVKYEQGWIALTNQLAKTDNQSEALEQLEWVKKSFKSTVGTRVAAQLVGFNDERPEIIEKRRKIFEEKSERVIMFIPGEKYKKLKPDVNLYKGDGTTSKKKEDFLLTDYELTDAGKELLSMSSGELLTFVNDKVAVADPFEGKDVGKLSDEEKLELTKDMTAEICRADEILSDIDHYVLEKSLS